jgi:hypothetical protein
MVDDEPARSISSSPPPARCGDDPPAGTALNEEVLSMRLGKEQAAGYIEDTEATVAAEEILSDSERALVHAEPETAVSAG